MEAVEKRLWSQVGRRTRGLCAVGAQRPGGRERGEKWRNALELSDRRLKYVRGGVTTPLCHSDTNQTSPSSTDRSTWHVKPGESAALGFRPSATSNAIRRVLANHGMRECWRKAASSRLINSRKQWSWHPIRSPNMGFLPGWPPDSRSNMGIHVKSASRRKLFTSIDMRLWSSRSPRRSSGCCFVPVDSESANPIRKDEKTRLLRIRTSAYNF